MLLFSAGLSALVYGLIEGQRYDSGTVADGITIGGIIAAGVVLLAAFAWWKYRQREPLVPLSLFGHRTFTIIVVLNVAVRFAL